MDKLLKFLAFALPALFVFTACSPDANPVNTESKNSETLQLFEKLSADQTGIDFNNKITEDVNLNFFVYDAVYQGSGVAVGDVNNDGLEDVFFAGNMVPEKLYLNQGDLKFKDITTESKIQIQNQWSTGVSMADVNGDGWMDIYVCNFLFDDYQKRHNRLFINNGDAGAPGQIPTFTESAKKYGLDDPGLSIAATFFDYDHDGDLDLYVCNQPPNSQALKKEMTGKKNYIYTDRLYKNNGDATFTDVTNESKIVNYTYSLSATIADLDQDGWPDIYVACDYEEPDIIYHNNRDGTFTNVVDESLKHMSNFSMGTDIADINNDGFPDIFSADMVAADNARLKNNMSGMNPLRFWQSVKNGQHYQYMFNTLQLNNGNGTFSDIAQLSGVSNTDWSWSPLLADFDNDGYRDLMVSNGIRRDMRNNDFTKKANAYGQKKAAEGITEVNPLELLNLAPSVRFKNYIYRNQGDLTFKKMMKPWGFDHAGWSQGAAYADLDNDGDLDLLLNNMDEAASVFRNNATELKLNNYLRIKLAGEGLNKKGYGAKVNITYANGQKQFQEIFPTKGFMSCSEAAAHFGLGIHTSVDQVEVLWPNGTKEIRKNVSVNQNLLFKEVEAEVVPGKRTTIKPLLADRSKDKGLNFQHEENEYDDFAKEILLPHRMSHLGPCLAKGDVNKDGLEDVFIGGAAGFAGALFLQKSNGNFQQQASPALAKDQAHEDSGALFFDADGDGDQDLYIASGGNEFAPNAPQLQDRLYLNNGQGVFTKSNGMLPNIRVSGAAIAATDFDGDGDQDLFVGGRQVPGKYGYVPESYLLINEGGKFVDQTKELAPELHKVGMVTDALWMDIDKDKDQDLVLVGEWMPISFFENNKNEFKSVTEDYGLQNTTGWWNCISAADLDGDGDQDLLGGNLGLNIKYKASPKEPFKVYIKDFDENGSNDVYLGYYDQDGVCYPVRGRECSSQQLPFVKSEFVNYESFSKATLEEVLGDRIKGAVSHQAQLFESVRLMNDNGVYKISPLPMEAQIAPVNGFVVRDWNGDGHQDILLAGNFYHREIETTRSDAGTGQILLGSEAMDYRPMPLPETGLLANRDARAIALLNAASEKPMLIIANNGSAVQVFQ